MTASRWLAPVVLVIAVVVAYAGSVSAPFLFDDQVAVVDNPTIRHFGFSALNPPANGGTTTGRPLVNLSYALNYAVSGLGVWSYHVLNIAIHALSTLLLFGIIRRTLMRVVVPPGEVGAAGGAALSAAPVWRERARGLPAIGCAAALLWALHPLQTETVVGIAQRTESLCALFYLLTLYAFIRSTSECAVPAGALRAEAAPARSVSQSPRGRVRAWQAVSVAACLLGMATKEVMVTAPVVVLLYDRTFVAGGFRRAWRRRWRYYLVLASTWLLLAALLARAGGSRGASAGFGLGIDPWHYLLKQAEALVLYARLAVWPYPLVLDYGTAVPTALVEVGWQCALVCVALAATAWALVRKPVWGFLAATFFLILAPSSSIVPLITQTMAEHRMYLPLAVITSALAVAVWRLAAASVLPVVALAIAFGAVTVARTAAYHDPVTVWADNVAQYPQAARPHNNLALALRQHGRDAEAEREFKRAIAIDPAYVTARYNYGVMLLDQGNLGGAVEQFQATTRLAPEHTDAHVNLGNALMRLGRPDDAVKEYETALRQHPAADIHYDAALAFEALHRDDDAAQELQAALAADPQLAAAHFELGRIASRAGQPDTAAREYEATLRLAPRHAAAHAELGLLLAQAGHLDEAATHLREAVRLDPDDIGARANLGNVMLLQGKAGEAIALYEEVLRRRPDDQRTRENLDLARSAAH